MFEQVSRLRSLLNFSRGEFFISNSIFRRDIQVLRGLAVLAVVLFHAQKNYFPLGYLGVDVFFVISGFVVTPLILQIFTEENNWGGRLSNLRYFYKRRFYRLAPALAVTLSISTVLIFLLGPISDHQRFVRQGIATLFLIGNFGAYRYSGDYFSSNPNPLAHTWSLAVEEQIYIFLPVILMLILVNKVKIKKITATVLFVIASISFISFLTPTLMFPIYSKIGTNYFGASVSFYSPVDRIWQFILGGLGFYLVQRYQSRKWKISRRVNLVLIIMVAIILFSPAHINLKVSSILASLIAMFLIVFKSLDALPDILIEKLEWLGDRSYSVYLIHMPLLYLAEFSPVGQIGNGGNPTFQSLIAVVGSVLLGALSYSKIENRYRNRWNAKVFGLKNFSVSLILTFMLPLALFVTVDVGLKRQYWGLNRNLQAPVSMAWVPDALCNPLGLKEPCQYIVAKSKPTVLIIGDSHASQYSKALRDSGKIVDWNVAVWTMGNCHFQFLRSKKSEVSDNCMSQNYAIFNWIKVNKPVAVVVSQFIYRDSNQINLRHALSALHLIVPNILLIENNPVFPDKKDFMVQRALVLSPYKPAESFKQSNMDIRDKDASSLLSKWARINGISTMNFDYLFCKNEICARRSGNKWLYADSNHLSVDGAALTVPYFSAYLKQLTKPATSSNPDK